MTTDHVGETKAFHARVELGELTVAPWNARRVMDDDAIKGLADSILKEGLLQPLVIRKRVAQGSILGEGFKEKWEVICGARRLMALKLIDAQSVTCWVVEATDQQAGLMNLAENVQRESLTPMDEAEAFGRLCDSEGMDAAAIAEEIGKDVTYVYRTMRLKALIPKFQTAVKDGKISKAVALEAARIPADQQGELAAMILRKGESTDAFSVTYVKDWIARHHMRPLKHAPWAMRDEMIGTEKIHGGMCGECPKRTGAEPVLFAEMKKTDDRCLDSGCWKKKTEQRIRVTVQQYPEIHLLKGMESPWKWKASTAKGALDGLVIDDGYGDDGIVAGASVKFQWAENAIGDQAQASKKSKAEAKKGRETIAIRSQVLAVTVASILIAGVVSKADVEMAIETFVGRMVNDDRRFLCKALKLTVETGRHGGKDFEATLMTWIKALKADPLRVFVVLALACHGARAGMFSKTDILMEMAAAQKVGVKSIEESVKAGKKKAPPAEKNANQKKVDRMAKATKAAGVKTRKKRTTKKT